MAGHSGKQAPRLTEVLARRGPHFSFLQAMWLLRRAAPDAVEPGHQGPVADEFARLVPSVSLAFPPGDIESFSTDESARPSHRLVTTFLGLYGAHSPLPSHYSEFVLQHTDEDDRNPVRDFFDIFNHRLLSLLYRGMVKYRGHMLFSGDGSDEYSWRLFALCGLDSRELIASTGLPGTRLLRFAGLWSQAPRSANSVAALLRSYLGIAAIQIEQCVARWVYLKKDQVSRLGVGNCQLGNDATIGARVRDHAGKFRVTIGPVDIATYRQYLPGSELLETVRRLVRLAVGDTLTFDVRLILDGGDTAQLRVCLGEEGELGRTSGLGPRSGENLAVVFG